MALNAATVWEVRTAGSDNSGGGFRAGASGTDRSQQDAAFKNGTNLTVDATTNTDVAPDGYSPDSTDVGNIIQITAGAGFTPGFYEIASIQSGKWRLDRSPAATSTSGGTWAYGGALASPGKACGAKIAGNTVWVKTGTYTATTASTNVSNGLVSDATGGECLGWEGYQTSRGDLGTPPVFSVGALTSATMFAMTAGSTPGMMVRNITTDGTARGNSNTGWSLARRAYLYRCRAQNCNVGLTSTDINTMTECVFTANNQGTSGTRGNFFACVATANFAIGFGTNGEYVDCLSYANSGGGSQGFSGSQILCINCVAYGNGSDGFKTFGEASVFRNCIAEGNGGWAFNANSAHPSTSIQKCATFNNTSGAVNTTLVPSGVSMVTYTASAFVAAGSGDFSLNNDPNGGALLRGQGYPGAMPLGLTTFYNDIGAGAHRDLFAYPRSRIANKMGGLQ